MPLDLFDWADTRPPAAPVLDRAHRGSVGYHKGAAAEDAVVRHYARLGYTVLHRRWRGRAGEIDLVCRGPGGLVFVEVKSARSFDAALSRIRPRQIARICASAAEYAGGSLTEMRFDAALMDRAGRLRVIENAFTFDDADTRFLPA